MHPTDGVLERLEKLDAAHDVLMAHSVQSTELDTAIDWVDDQIGESDPIVEWTSRMKDMTRTEIGGLIAWYFNEASHEGWEGFEPRDKTGIRKFLMDLMVFHEASVKKGAGQTDFAKDTYFTGSHYITKDMTDEAPKTA